MEMDVDHTNIIRRHYEFLRDKLEPEPLADYLYSEKKITRTQHERILYQKGRAATKQCLDILQNNSISTFYSFITFLKLDDARSFIVKELEKDMVQEIRVVMFGKTGVGKSRLGNNILDKENYFPSRGTAKSFTKQAKRGERMIGIDYKLVLVDTPGLFDPDINNNMETAKILASTVRETKPGPHVFIFVLSMYFRYTVEEKAAIAFLKDLLGSHVTAYLIIVFTGKDTIDEEKIDFETYIDEAGDDLKDLLSQCRGRVAINNRASHEKVTRSVGDILQLITGVYLQNKKKYYTDELLTEADKQFKEKLRLQDEEAHRRERELERENKKLREEKYNNIYKIEALEKYYKETQKKYEDEIREKERIRLQAEEAFKRESEIAKANKKLEKKINDLSKDFEYIRTKYTELIEVRDTQDAKYKQLLQTISENSTKIIDLENEKEEARKEYEENIEEMSEKAGQKCNVKLQELLEKIDALRNENKEKEEEMYKMRKEIEENIEEISRLKNEWRCTIQ